ncbi:pentatricopeptide repeat-containing protein ELI1, chloroplastic [Spinacia oleracea]|uniref:Pentatricopeptide repeat-containing protein ELI1, chloroplastic n=1 Tax=Spinacia oleracea TaxID=3562 RepID=A0A9R0JJG3_SPIOL|nr:pentatricopeptide repeat-containing protein ELI1, chloroplastic [Spinacia oleracea]XP_056696877.1 pentatricopeptide repeat-containing protein ELI1, chloroplastic [Spinacia oleracea]
MQVFTITNAMSSSPLFTSQTPPPPNGRTSNLSPPSSHRPQPEKLAFLLDKCRNLTQLLQIHAVILRQGHENNPILNFKLQKTCSSIGHLDRSFSLFKRTANPDVYLYTSIINSHSSRGLQLKAFELYVQMLTQGVEPNAFTFSSLLKCCLIKDGVLIHSQAIKLGYDQDLFVRTGLLDVYAKGGDVVSARQLFDTMPERSLVPLTAMLTYYAKHGHLDDARVLFDGMEEKDVVCWNVMIDGYAQHGRPNDALILFQKMLKAKFKPTEFTVLSILSACGQLGAFELGKWVHSYIMNNKIKVNVHVGTALVDMYAKCGSLKDAKLVFDGIIDKDVVLWNSMIVGYAMHGFSKEALQLFDELLFKGLRPTYITFIGVLNACAHAGLVSAGKKFFALMKDAYNLEPKIEHYGCMVNLLGRAGHLDQAYDLVKANVNPDPVLFGTLLGACRLHGNISLGEEIAKFLVTKNLANDGTYVLLSNIYAGVGDWDGVANVRAMMKEKGIQKEPGCTSIEVNNKVHEFLAGDLRHPMSKEIYKMLEEITKLLKVNGYVPQIETVLSDVGVREKEQSLGVHSERLAIAFGLISTSPGTTIKIAKNLRVCSDCHVVTKLISKITGRRIVVRDRNRFHHFENGICSCGDYW